MTKVLFESEGRNHNGDPFFCVKEARGYYVYGERVGQDSIAFILWDSTKKKFALIKESKPPLDERYKGKASLTTAFGGSLDMDLKPNEITQIEVLEEAGYEVKLDKIYEMGETMVSTQMSQLCYLFLVDVTNTYKTAEAEYEAPGSTDDIQWMTETELIENSDWKSIMILTKARYLNVI